MLLIFTRLLKKATMANLKANSLNEKLDYFFKTSFRNRDEVTSFILSASKISDPIIFGGMLRDISLGGNRSFYSDIDIVLKNISEKDFVHFISQFNPSKNIFGGARIHLNNWPLDIWRIEDTWAIKNNFVTFNDEKTLLKTTFFNWDSIIYNFKAKELSFSDKYFQDLENKTLEINFEPNPNPGGAVRRIAKFLKGYEAKATERVCQYFIGNLHFLDSSISDSHKRELYSIKNHMESFLKEKTASHFSLQTEFSIESKSIFNNL